MIPSNLEAEQGLLSALLVSNKSYDQVFDVIREEHFFSPAHQMIFREIKARIESGRPASAVTIHPSLSKEASLDEYGGAQAYLTDLYNCNISTVNARDYAQHIRDLHIKRELISVLMGANDKLSSGGDLDDILASTESAIFGIRQNDVDEARTAPEGWNEALKWIEDVRSGKIKATSTGYQSLDEIIQGLYPGRLYVLAARPGMGKTALGLNIAENVSQKGHVLFFSLEMPEAELLMRMAARKTGISVQRQAKGQLSDQDIRALSGISHPKTFHIYERSGIDIDHITMTSRRFARKYKPELIVIDYLGLINGDARMQKVHQIEAITTRLKSLSKELKVPIILVSQLSRSLEQRDDKRPILADLRDSGAIEQDADVVMFVYRPEYYADRDEPQRKTKETQESFSSRLTEFHRKADADRGKAHVIVAKNRQGTMDTSIMNFDGVRQHFFEGDR